MKKFTWAHGIIVAMLAFVIFILGMIFYFTQNWQNAEMVSDNYYEEELNYQQIIDAKNRADALPEQPRYEQTSQGVKLLFPKSFSNANATYHFDLYRTDDKNLDIKKDFQLEADNTFTIPNEVLVPGHYTLKLHWKQGGQDYQKDYDILWK